MPRVLDLTAKGYDTNGKEIVETGAVFPHKSKPSKKDVREHITPRIASAAANNNIAVSSISTVEVIGMAEDYTFSFDTKAATKAKPTSVKPKAKPAKKTASKKKAASKKSGPSKKDQAIELYKQHKDKSRKEVIQVLVDQLGMTPAGASTYYSTVKKSVEG